MNCIFKKTGTQYWRYVIYNVMALLIRIFRWDWDACGAYRANVGTEHCSVRAAASWQFFY